MKLLSSGGLAWRRVLDLVWLLTGIQVARSLMRATPRSYLLFSTAPKHPQGAPPRIPSASKRTPRHFRLLVGGTLHTKISVQHALIDS